MPTCVDLFCGFGGFSLGAAQAGARVIHAVDLWSFATEVHATNHPHASHTCTDLTASGATGALPPHDILLASPPCQGHSKAAVYMTDTRRADLQGASWAVVRAAETHRPKAIVVENVVQLAKWGGFEVWCGALEDLGYHLDSWVLTASHFGVPQRRRRLFVVATQNGHPGAPPDGPETPFGPFVDERAAGWAPLASKPLAVRERVENGHRRGLGPRFLTQHTAGHSGVPLTEPIRTITTRSLWCLVDGDRMRPLSILEHARAMGFPEGYQVPAGTTKTKIVKGLGNAVVPAVARWVVGRVMEAL